MRNSLFPEQLAHVPASQYRRRYRLFVAATTTRRQPTRVAF
jgi:hypothetical protein